MSNNTNSYIFAAVPYANAAPLVHFLDRLDAGVRVIYARPSELAECVLTGRADAALVPVVDCFANDELRMIDGPGICADGDVRSVLLKCDRPLARVRLVRPDAASRTSNALAGVLLDEHFRVPAELTDADGPADAEVVIGDRALREPPAACRDYDLAGEWKAMTALPLVFAAWAHRADRRDADALAQIVRRARAAGLAAIDELAAIQARRIHLPVAECLDYLTTAVRYDVGPQERAGMALFERLLGQRAGVKGPAR